MLPNVASAQSGAPGTPSWVTLSRADGTVTATWESVSGATTYYLRYSDDDRATWKVESYDHSTNSITISADNSLTYVFAVVAGNGNGWGRWAVSDPAGPYTGPSAPAPTPTATPEPQPTATPTPIPTATPVPVTPGPIGSISVSRWEGSLTASWNAVPGAAYYHVTYSVDGGEAPARAAYQHPASSPTTSLAIQAAAAATYIIGARGQLGRLDRMAQLSAQPTRRARRPRVRLPDAQRLYPLRVLVHCNRRDRIQPATARRRGRHISAPTIRRNLDICHLPRAELRRQLPGARAVPQRRRRKPLDRIRRGASREPAARRAVLGNAQPHQLRPCASHLERSAKQRRRLYHPVQRRQPRHMDGLETGFSGATDEMHLDVGKTFVVRVRANNDSGAGQWQYSADLPSPTLSGESFLDYGILRLTDYDGNWRYIADIGPRTSPARVPRAATT